MLGLTSLVKQKVTDLMQLGDIPTHLCSNFFVLVVLLAYPAHDPSTISSHALD